MILLIQWRYFTNIDILCVRHLYAYEWKHIMLNYFLKCPYYGFLKITFHAVCNTDLSEWKHPENI